MIKSPIEQKVSKKKEPIKITFLQRVSVKEKIFFIQNIKTMIKAGMSLTESLQALEKQTTNDKFKGILKDIITSIEKGQTLSIAMGKHPKVFSNIFVNMIAAGESSGNLENILEQLYLQIKKDHELISKIRGAMTYPSVVLIAMLIMVVGMFTFVFPTFVTIFEEANAELPMVTQMLIGVSDIVNNHGLALALGVVAFIIAFIKIIKTKGGKKIFDIFLLKMFIIGPIAQKVNLARFSRSISSLLQTEIPVIKSFEITASVVSNSLYKEALLESIEKIKKGSTISETLSAYPKLFTPMIIQMIMVGEKSGTTDTILKEIANYYEEEVDNTTKNLSSIIEPLLILIIGVGVGGIAVAVMMPMYNLTQSF
jgi:type IV pilus assembly protein PilC